PAVGRLERQDVVGDTAGALADANGGVRATAAEALGQAASRGGAAAARAALVARLKAEADVTVRAAIAETLGRLSPASADEAASTAQLLARMTYATDDTTRDAPAWVLPGVARGFFFLTRKPAARGAITGSVADRLRHLVAYERTPSRAEVGQLLRRQIGEAAAAALVASAAATA